MLIKEAVKRMMIRLFLCVFSVPTRIGKKRIDIPNIMQILAMLDPIISPKEREGTFCTIEETAMESSGIDVPSATAVAPMMRGESLRRELNFFAELTKKFAEKTSPIKLEANIK